MMLSEKDATLYYKLRDELFIFSIDIFFTKKMKKLHDKTVDFPIMMNSFAHKIFNKNNRHILDTFVRMNPSTLPEEELAIVRSWKNFIHGNFLLFEQQQDFAIFLRFQDNGAIPYGVRGLTESIGVVCRKADVKLPIVVSTILLPFKGTIIYHGLLGFGDQFSDPTRIDLQKFFSERISGKSVITSLEPGFAPEKLSNEQIWREY